MRKFTTIKLPNSVSQVRRLPRLGKIRLGMVVTSGKSGKEYPRETDYFVCPPEVQAVYGEIPKALDVMFPVEQEEMIFPQFLGAYGGNHKLLCHGDGENAERWDKDATEWLKRDCPCEWLEEGKCDRRANLLVVLPKVNLGGVYQIDSGSFNTIVNLNSYFEYLRFLVGRISWVPVKLIREAQQTLDPDGKQQTHYPIKVVFEGTVEAVNALRQETKQIMAKVQTYALPEPIIEGPLPDTPREIESPKEEKETEPQNGKGVSIDSIRIDMKAAKLQGEATRIFNSHIKFINELSTGEKIGLMSVRDEVEKSFAKPHLCALLRDRTAP